MRKELIWNTGLLLAGIFLILFITLNITPPSIIPGWREFPFNLGQKLFLGLFLGLIFVVSRYINLGILAIPHKEFRLLVMMLSYLFPLTIVLLSWHHLMDEITQSALSNLNSTEHEAVSDLKIDPRRVKRMEDIRFEDGLTTYAQLIKNLGQLSDGKFQPEKILEDWEPDQSIELSFSFKAKKHQIVLKQGLVDENIKTIVRAINQLVEEEDYQFYFVKGKADLVVGLSRQELKILTRLTDFQMNNTE
jgi:hypothetical protein